MKIISEKINRVIGLDRLEFDMKMTRISLESYRSILRMRPSTLNGILKNIILNEINLYLSKGIEPEKGDYIKTLKVSRDSLRSACSNFSNITEEEKEFKGINSIDIIFKIDKIEYSLLRNFDVLNVSYTIKIDNIDIETEKSKNI